MMLAEAAAAVLLGIGVLWLVFQPFLAPAEVDDGFVEPPELEETPRGQALMALREIEFDRETGKLSDADYAFLKARYAARAIDAMRDEDAAAPGGGAGVEAMIAARVERLRAAPADGAGCPRCGPRPEVDALWCSSCGMALPGRPACLACRAPLDPEARFCAACGAPASGAQVAGSAVNRAGG